MEIFIILIPKMYCVTIKWQTGKPPTMEMGSTNLRLSLVGSIYLYKNNNNFENIFLTNSAVNGTKVIWSG